MKPSQVLVMGGYVAGVHHLRMLQETFPKDKHGLRERDLDHKDKQNFDAVMHITSKSVIELLQRFPDAKGTMIFLVLVRCVIDSFLDKQLDMYSRIKKAWYAVFFMRYWRQWLLSNKNYTLGNNFITSNAYKCIEINAHSLVTFLLTIRDKLPANNECFFPWMLGSQSCEKAFRAVRSMSSTYSTILNFGMLGLLRRLHRMQIQFNLESEADVTGISYPNVNRHKVKDGMNKSQRGSECLLDNTQIAAAVEEGKKDAQNSIEELGMADSLRKTKYWKKPTMIGIDEKEEDDGDEDDKDEDDKDEDEDSDRDQSLTDLTAALQEVASEEEEKNLASEITELTSAGLIESDLSSKLMSMHKTVFRRIPGTQLPLYSAEHDKASKPKRYNSCVAVKHNGTDIYIHKTTLCWLFQEGERVSTDRLFRVRKKQPLSCDEKTKPSTESQDESTCPEVLPAIRVSDVCAFVDPESGWKLGKVIKFANYMEKKIGSRNYSSDTVTISNSEKVGILCSWYKRSDTKFTVVCSHEQVFQPVTSYLCTISHACVDMFEGDTHCPTDSILKGNSKGIDFATAQHITIKDEALVCIDNLAKKLKTEAAIVERVTAKDKGKKAVKDNWLTIGDIVLKKKHRQEVTGGKELTDMPVNAYQLLLKSKLPKLHGLQNTLLQDKKPLEHTCSEALQIIHVKKNHWATIKITGSNVYLYDSSNKSASGSTEKTIAQLVHSKDKHISIHIMNISKQAGNTDCGLFAMASLTLLALKMDPTTVVFEQKDLRQHLIQSFEKRAITSFPISKTRRPASSVSNIQHLPIYCYCRLPDDGTKMSGCDSCKEWFHDHCIIRLKGIPPKKGEPGNWYCKNCSSS